MVLACALGSIRVPVRGPRAARDSDDFAAQANAFESAVKRRLLDAEDGEGGLDGEGDVSMPQEGVGANDTERDRGEERPVAAQDDARTSPAPAAVSGEEPGVSQRSERPNSTPAESHDAPLPMPVIKASFRGLPGSGTARVAQRTIVTEGGEERVAAPATLSLRAEARLPPRAAQVDASAADLAWTAHVGVKNHIEEVARLSRAGCGAIKPRPCQVRPLPGRDAF